MKTMAEVVKEVLGDEPFHAKLYLDLINRLYTRCQSEDYVETETVIIWVATDAEVNLAGQGRHFRYNQYDKRLMVVDQYEEWAVTPTYITHYKKALECGGKPILSVRGEPEVGQVRHYARYINAKDQPEWVVVYTTSPRRFAPLSAEQIPVESTAFVRALGRNVSRGENLTAEQNYRLECLQSWLYNRPTQTVLKTPTLRLEDVQWLRANMTELLYTANDWVQTGHRVALVGLLQILAGQARMEDATVTLIIGTQFGMFE